MNTLALSPRNPTVDKFDKNSVLSELDDLIRFCRNTNVEKDMITDINVKTVTYNKQCNKQKSSINIQMTKKYLKDNKLIAIPFDKGIGICVLSIENYSTKLNDIIQLPQFEKVQLKRKNEKHTTLKEEERIVTALKKLKESNKISESIYSSLKPTGSQPVKAVWSCKNS